MPFSGTFGQVGAERPAGAPRSTHARTPEALSSLSLCAGALLWAVNLVRAGRIASTCGEQRRQHAYIRGTTSMMVNEASPVSISSVLPDGFKYVSGCTKKGGGERRGVSVV